MKAVRQIQILFFIIFLLSGISLNAQKTTDDLPENLSENDLIHSGDIIDVDIIGSSEFDWRGTLTPEGNLDGLNFTESPVYALCKSVEYVGKEVAASYSKLLREPKIKVTILDRSNRSPATIFGAVKYEQKFQIKRPVLLNELIVLSGGFTDKSSGTIQIVRPPGGSCLSDNIQNTKEDSQTEKVVKTSQTEISKTINFSVTDLISGKFNPQIFSGDIITVLEANPIYVIGGVNNPKAISSREKMTLSRTIASAGGFSRDAESDKITIFRQKGVSTDIIEVEFDKIKADGENDIFLQDFDIVEVGIKGRSKNKFPPVIENSDSTSKKINSLPLRIID